MSQLSVSERSELEDLRKQRDQVRAYIVEEMRDAAMSVVDYSKNTPKLDRLVGLYGEFRDAKAQEVITYLGKRLVETSRNPSDFTKTCDELERLMRLGANANFVHASQTALLNACQQANLRGVKLMLEWHADPNLLVDSFTLSSPLHLVADTRVPAIAAELVFAGGDLTKRDARGHTPLEIAEKAKNFEVSNILRSGEAKQFAELAAGEIARGLMP